MYIHYFFFFFLSVQSMDKPRPLRNTYCMYKSTFKDLDFRCAKNKERLSVWFLLLFLFSRKICLMCLLPASSSWGFDVSKWCSFLSVAWQRAAKNRCGSEWRWARGRREEKEEREEESWSARQRRLLFFSFSGVCGTLHFSSPTSEKGDVMCCWAPDDSVRDENISHSCSQVTFWRRLEPFWNYGWIEGSSMCSAGTLCQHS